MCILCSAITTAITYKLDVLDLSRMSENYKFNDLPEKSSNGFVQNGTKVNCCKTLSLAVNNKLVNNLTLSSYKETMTHSKIYKKDIDEEMDRCGPQAAYSKEPPDGGARSWIIMFSAFLCNGVTFGIINTYGIIYMLLVDQLSQQGDKQASTKAGKFTSFSVILAAYSNSDLWL